MATEQITIKMTPEPNGCKNDDCVTKALCLRSALCEIDWFKEQFTQQTQTIGTLEKTVTQFKSEIVLWETGKFISQGEKKALKQVSEFQTRLLQLANEKLSIEAEKDNLLVLYTQLKADNLDLTKQRDTAVDSAEQASKKLNKLKKAFTEVFPLQDIVKFNL